MPRKTGFFDILHSYLRKKPPSQCEKCLILPRNLALPLVPRPCRAIGSKLIRSKKPAKKPRPAIPGVALPWIPRR
jgi:hypothetical protein